MSSRNLLALVGRDVRDVEEYPETDGTELLTLISPRGRPGRVVEGNKALDTVFSETFERIGVPSLVSFSALRHVNPEKVGDWDPTGATDNTATLIAAQVEAAANNLYIDGQGAAIGLNGSTTRGWQPVTDVRLRDIAVKDLNPGNASRRTIYGTGLSRVFLDGVSFDRGGDGAGGALATAASSYFSSIGEFRAEDCKFTGNDAGNGLVVTDSIGPRLLNSDFYDFYYVHAAQADDQVQGAYLVRCLDVLVQGNTFKRMGRTDQTSASRDRFSRPLALSGCSGRIIGNTTERCDVGMDISGGGGNRRLIVEGNVIRNVATFGIKLANTGNGIIVIGNNIDQAGYGGIVASVFEGSNYTADDLFANNIITRTGTNQIWSANSPVGVRVLVGTGTISQYAPNGVMVRGNKIRSHTAASTFTVFDTDELTLTTPLILATGQRGRATTSGTLPTNLALATNYYVIVVDDTSSGTDGGRIKLASSYINALDGIAITGYAGGSGNHTFTMQSDMVSGGVNETPFNASYPPNIWGADNTVRGQTGAAVTGFHNPMSQGKVDVQSIANNTVVDIQCSELLIPGMGAISISVPDIIPPYDGRWRLEVESEFTSNSTGTRSLQISKNIAAGGYVVDPYSRRPALAYTGGAQYKTTEGTYELTTADKLKPQAFQTSGGALDVAFRVSLIPVHS